MFLMSTRTPHNHDMRANASHVHKDPHHHNMRTKRFSCPIYVFFNLYGLSLPTMHHICPISYPQIIILEINCIYTDHYLIDGKCEAFLYPYVKVVPLGTGAKFGRIFGLITCGQPQLKLLLLSLFCDLRLRPISTAGRRKLQPNLAPTPYSCAQKQSCATLFIVTAFVPCSASHMLFYINSRWKLFNDDQ